MQNKMKSLFTVLFAMLVCVPYGAVAAVAETAAQSGDVTDSNDIAEEFKGQGYGILKTYVADVVAKELTKIQERYNAIINSDMINETLKEGAIKASAIAHRKLLKVRKKIGLEIR